MAVPGLKDGDLALLAVVSRTFPPWFMGLVGAAGAVTAMVPASVLLLAAATLIAKNVYRPLRRAALDERHLMRASRVVVMGVALAASVLALWAPRELVSLLIFGYDGISQFFPGIVLGLFVRRLTALPVALGLVAGEAVVLSLLWGHHDPFLGMNAGFVGLAVNFAVTAAALAVARPHRESAERGSAGRASGLELT
jgi:SSS family solute:Na+ symporter